MDPRIEPACAGWFEYDKQKYETLTKSIFSLFKYLLINNLCQNLFCPKRYD